MMKNDHNNALGFSLMEVNIAIALISVGLLAIFSLFPLGLKESNLSVSDNHEAMFANHVLSCMESNAMQISNWSDWSDVDTFMKLIVKDVYPVKSNVSRTAMGGGASGGIAFPEFDTLSGKLIRYDLQVLKITGQPAVNDMKMYLLQLRVMSGKYGDFATFKNTYATVVTYTGS